MTKRPIYISSLDSERIRKKIMDVKARSGFLSKDLKILLEELNRATVLKPEEMPADVLTMNSVVKLKYITSGEILEVKIVYPEDADVKNGRISIFAPIATALLGYRKGEIINWPVHNTVLKVMIEDIIYQPESEGHFQV